MFIQVVLIISVDLVFENIVVCYWSLWSKKAEHQKYRNPNLDFLEFFIIHEDINYSRKLDSTTLYGCNIFFPCISIPSHGPYLLLYFIFPLSPPAITSLPSLDHRFINIQMPRVSLPQTPVPVKTLILSLSHKSPAEHFGGNNTKWHRTDSGSAASAYPNSWHSFIICQFPVL